MGFRWKIGNGEKVKFWKDNWLGSSSLVIQYWGLYRIVNEQNRTVKDLWDGIELKCTFRRTFTPQMMALWDEVVQHASVIVFSNDEDALVWQYNTSGFYSSQSLYSI